MCEREGYSLLNRYGAQRVVRDLRRGSCARIKRYMWRDTLSDLARFVRAVRRWLKEEP